MNAPASTQTLSEMRLRGPEAPQRYAVALTDSQGFELVQRAAKLLAASGLVPKEYQNHLPNCVIALNMAQRVGADPLMVMQNLVIVHGRPTWSSQFLISTVNTCGRFSALRYEFFGEAGADSWGCRAWAVEKATGEKLVGTDITLAIARKEGWYDRKGSKWQTIPQQMLMYRAGAWWCRAYAPELSMGLHSVEEVHDIIEMNPDGSIASVSSESPRTKEIKTPDLTQPAAAAENHKTGEIHNGSPAFAESEPHQPLEKRAQASGESEPPSTRPGRVMSGIE